ncbi:UNVERIFIED_CONTAM: hypothetical protein GTU68_017764 [Idotea baltica]|nr:hypothetical protein [Idotea baltica]
MEPEKIGEILTDIGLEVEGMDQIESIEGGLEGLVIGKILSCEKHSNADTLQVTTVDVGAEEPLHIVCGAPNCKTGQTVVVATHGTTIYPTEGDSFKIKKGKIRGEVSEGMLCAEDEIGMGQSHDGIIVLEGDVAPGTKAKDHFKVSTDYVYEIGLTPNRCDATSHIGVAEDLLAYLKINHDYTEPIDYPNLVNFQVEATTLPFKISVENEKACPRYCGITLSNVEVKPSPQWLKDNLNSIGVSPINNIVDITNFVLHEYGQPLHAFDADKIAGHKVIVANLPAGTPFTTLDEKERKLRAEDLMICDGDKTPMCIAGVFGGINSGVSVDTKNIFLESAHFDSGSTRRTSTAHLLRTDAAKVFEKGSDPNITIKALKRAALLIEKLSGAKISSEIYDHYPVEIKREKIELHYAKVNGMIGVDIPKDKVHDILTAMNMELKPIDNESILVKVPTNKCEVLREVDLVEEILRIYGFNKVPIPTTIKSSITYKEYPSKRDVRERISDFLSSNGFNEMMGLSLIESKNVLEQLKIGDEKLVYINNTSNIHLNVMRPEAMVSGLVSVLHNHNYSQRDLALYEFGKTYQKDGEGFIENRFMSVFITGSSSNEHWETKSEQNNLYSIKKWTNWILERIGITSYQVAEVEGEKWDYGISYKRGKNEIVSFGSVSADVLDALDIKSEVFCAVFNMDNIYKFTANNKLQVSEISKYPAVRRDLALVLDEEVAFEGVQAATKKLKSKILQQISLFDVYKSEEHLGKGKKSYAVKFMFQDLKNTLKDKVVDKEVNQLIKIFEQDLGATIRS